MDIGEDTNLLRFLHKKSIKSNRTKEQVRLTFYLCFNRDMTMQTTATIAPSRTTAPIAIRVTSKASNFASAEAGRVLVFR